MDKEDAKKTAKNIFEEVQGGVNEIIGRVRELIKEGTARKLMIVNKKGEVVFQTQLAFGVGGAALVAAMAPVVSAIGMFAMFLNDYQVIVERVATKEDEFSVDADVIEIVDEDEEPKAKSDPKKDETSEEKEEKTVGKKKD